jgi:hypothetical protein
MARIIYTALVDHIAGSINGSSFQRNAYGHSIKSKGSPVLKNSITQVSRRLTMQSIVKAWAGLTNANRNAWALFAQTYPTKSKRNTKSYLNGFNLFQRFHFIKAMGTTFAVLAQPDGSYYSFSYVSCTLVLSAGTTLTFTLSFTSDNDDWTGLISLSNPLPASRKFNSTKPKLVDRQNDSGTLPDLTITKDITASYVALFGALPSIGDLVSWKTWLFDPNTGQLIDIPLSPLTVT